MFGPCFTKFHDLSNLGLGKGHLAMREHRTGQHMFRAELDTKLQISPLHAPSIYMCLTENLLKAIVMFASTTAPGGAF